MASRSKKKTTMAKLNRESRLRERRLEKKARKDDRKQAAANPPEPVDVEAQEDADSPHADSPHDAIVADTVG